MKSLKLNKFIPYAIILLLLVCVFACSNKEKIKEVIPAQSNTQAFENPVAEVRIDTIYKTVQGGKKIIEKLVPVENPINKELLSKYEQAMKDNDSLKALTLYKEAVTERNYTETLEDSVQTITVKSEVIGRLKRQSIHYLTKEKTVEFKVKKPKASVFAGVFSYLPTKAAEVPVIGLNLNLLNKTQKRLLTVGFDNEKRVHVGCSLKLF